MALDLQTIEGLATVHIWRNLVTKSGMSLSSVCGFLPHVYRPRLSTFLTQGVQPTLKRVMVLEDGPLFEICGIAARMIIIPRR